jgi:hypothetical protein
MDIHYDGGVAEFVKGWFWLCEKVFDEAASRQEIR